MKGEARKRPNGTWEWRGYITDPAKGRRRVSVYGKTRAEAVTKAEDLINRERVQAPIRDSQKNAGDWMLHWSTVILPNSGLAPNTIAQYQSLVRTHLADALAGVRLCDVRPSTVQEVLARLSTKPRKDGQAALSESTRRSVYAALRKAFDAAVDDRLIMVNPVAAVKRPKSAAVKPRALTMDDQRRILEAARGHRWYPVVVVLLTAGLRRGEALGLMWEDTDLDAGTLTITGSLSRSDGRRSRGTTKSATSTRTVPIPSGVVAELRKVRAEVASNRLQAGSMWQGTSDRGGYVFTTALGSPIDPRNFSRWYATITIALGISDSGAHALRHSAATAWVQAGVDIRTVAELLGHSDGGALALRVYASSDDTVKRSAVSGRSAALGLG